MRRIPPHSIGMRVTLLVALAGWLALASGAALARTETLEWTQASPERVAGFEVLVGSSSGNYQQVLDVGMATLVGSQQFSTDISVADDATVYVAVRAYGHDGLRSANSNERVRVASTGGGGSGGSGSGGSGSGGSGSGGSGSGGDGDPGGDPDGGGDFPILETSADIAFPHGRAVLAEDFEGVGLGASIPGWIDTAANMSLVEDDTLFEVAEHSRNRVLTTSRTGTSIHSHYLGSGSDSWSDYFVTGAMGIGVASGGVGVTFYSQFDSQAAYYRLGRFGSRAFELVMEPEVACSDPSTDVVPVPDRWYRFRVRVDEVASGTRIRARVWRADQAEPAEWQAACLDSSGTRPREGTVGVWSMGQGAKYWDEIQVIPLVTDGDPVDVADPEILSPEDGAVLPGSSATFRWRQNDGLVTDWWLWVGTTPGGSDVFDSGAFAASQTSITVADLPTDGSTLYVRLFYRRGAGAWESIDTSVRAATVQGETPALVMPVPGGAADGSGTFQWTSPSGVANQFWLYVGSTPGGAEYHDSGALGAVTHTSVSGLPMDGRNLYVRLWYRKGVEAWRFVDATVKAASLADPGIETPVAGSTIAPGQTFQWSNPGSVYDQWWLYLGSTPGGSDLLDTGLLKSRSYSVGAGALAGGGTVYARLWYRRGAGAWSYVDSSYQSVGPTFTAPAAGARLRSESFRFRWSGGGSPASDWWLWLGTGPGKKDLLDSGNLGEATDLRVSGLPVGGAKIHARLWFRTPGSEYAYIDRVFETTAPQLVTPGDGGHLGGSTATLSWSGAGLEAGDWWVYLGSKRGGSDWLDSGNLGNETSLTVEGLPTDGRSLHLRLWYRVGDSDAWHWQDFSVVAGP